MNEGDVGGRSVKPLESLLVIVQKWRLRMLKGERNLKLKQVLNRKVAVIKLSDLYAVHSVCFNCSTWH